MAIPFDYSHSIARRTPSLFVLLGLLVSLPLCADQVRFDTARDWQQWRLPLGAVELTPDGTVTPVFI